MIHHFLEDDLVHELVSLDRLLLGDADELLLQRNRPVAVVEVEEAGLQVDAEERGDVLKKRKNEKGLRFFFADGLKLLAEW